MKKTLRTLAISALAMPMIASASAQFTVETVWANVVKDGVSNPIEGPDGGWGKPTATDNGGKTVCRFAVGKDGKVLMNDHKANAIVAWDGSAMTTYAQLPAVTVTDWNGNETVEGTKWNGTAVTTDDAGNVIYDYCFINADKSLQYWGVIAADGTITDVDLSTPLAELGSHGRLDIIGHIVGDVNSEKGGIGYATTASSDNVIMFHFKGDGTKVTSLTAKSYTVEGLASNGLNVPSAKYLTVDEILASATPEQEFYLPTGALGSATVTDGTLIAGAETLTGYGNRQYNLSATFELDGKKYIVRNYVDATVPDYLTNWKGVMTFGIFDLESGECVASWMGSDYTNAYGMGNVNAEVVDENTVNIYMYVCTGSKDDASGTIPGAYAAMVKLTKEDVTVELPDFVGDGTEENPYQIATAEDLCNAYRVVNNAGGHVWFAQTADIDMEGVKEFHAISGYNGVYSAIIHYDGKNHIITNFAPENVPFANVAETDFYYCTSLFGVASGEISNLGVVNATCVTDHGAGILGAYAGHSTAAALILDNVFVTGTVIGTGGYTGGMFGTTGNEVTMTNCFANVNVEGSKYPAGLIGRASNNINLERVYVAGTVKASDESVTPYLVMGTNKAPEYMGYQVIAFNTGADEALAADIAIGDEEVTVASATDTEAIAEVKSWTGYSETSTILGLPALEWVPNEAGVNDITVDNENAPVEYYNLRGIRVNQPAAGSIVIKKQGTSISKMIVR